MRVLGQERSRRWVATGSVLLVVASPGLLPLLLMAFFMANDVAGAVLGPPAIWKRPRQMPSPEQLAGNRIESSRTLDHSFDGPKAAVELHRDGTMSVRDLPFEEPNLTHCRVSGTGYWSRSYDGHQLDLRLEVPIAPATCPAGDYGGLAVAGHRRPYSLYWIVSDPDSGTGVWLASNR